MLEMICFWALALVVAAMADEAEQRNNLVVCMLMVIVASAFGLLGAAAGFEVMLSVGK